MQPPIDSKEDFERAQKKKKLAIQIAQAVTSATVAASIAHDASLDGGPARSNVDHRTLPRGERREFRHDQALMCINRDYLGPKPLFADKQFKKQFRIEQSRMERLIQDVGNSGISYYLNRTDASGREGSTMEARLLLPLKTLAYGVPPHCFQDYFQMSDQMARQACREFDLMLQKIYKEEYLRVPTQHDAKRVMKLHASRHKVQGMFASLDCMHVPWKNCPVAWQGNYQGAKGVPTLVLEAACDYHMWFWSACFGYAGTLNDKTILSLSELYDKLIDGTFLHIEAQCVPYKICDEEFNKMFILVDGIYPQWARFVKGFKEPVFESERKFSEWQESARKDIERAFGNLQQKFQFMSRPIQLIDLHYIGDRVTTCLILHNMCISDRIMEDPWLRYDPAFSVLEELPENVEQPDDLQELQGDTTGILSKIGIDKLPLLEKRNIIRRYLLDNLRDQADHVRLTHAIMKLKLMQARIRQGRR